jgi:Tol biopolymer transport system component
MLDRRYVLRLGTLALIIGGALAAVLLADTATLASPGQTTRVSVDSAGSEGNKESREPSVSANGRYVAFESQASNLVSGDTNNTWDIFVRDRETGKTTRVSVDSDGKQGNSESHYPSISADGRYVVFESFASNLVPGDTNGTWDIFLRDRQTNKTTLVSVDSAGNPAKNDTDYSSFPAISADGRYVAFMSRSPDFVTGDTNGRRDIFVHDRQTGETTRVSVDSSGQQGDQDSWNPAISSDGRYVAFHSTATNLVPGDTNNFEDVFVHDRQTGETTRVSVDSAGNQGNGDSQKPAISADGRYVAFESRAVNIVQGDTSDTWDVFVHDRQTGETTQASVDSAGNQANAASQFAAISADGRYVAFQSGASNLVPDDTNNSPDVFVHDRQTGETTRVSVDSAGDQGSIGNKSPGGLLSGEPGSSVVVTFSGDGRYLAFTSEASNLVSGDTNGYLDVFLYDRDPSAPSNFQESGGTSSSQTGKYAVIAALAALAVVIAVGGGWYARRRLLR